MGNQAHLEKLGEGVAAWNRWRSVASVKPDLSEFDLKSYPNCAGIDFTAARLERADLTGVSLRGALLQGAHLAGAKLVGVDFAGSDMSAADLTGAIVDGAKYDRRMTCLGARVDLCTGSPRFVRHVLETDYIESFRSEHRLLSALWGLTSSYSRSFLRAAVVAVALVVGFSMLYALIPDMLHWPSAPIDRGSFEPIYYSASVFATLGASAIYPRRALGEIVTTTEVILGYIWLGYLVSILAQRANARF